MDFSKLIEPLQWYGIVTTLICGFIIGLERQISGKPAGIRTSCLICLGTYLFVASGVSFHVTSVDPTRIIGQVVTGIGFLGAGVILTRDGIIIGITSASVIWILAGIGVLVGLNYCLCALTITAITIGILVGINLLEGSFSILRRGLNEKLTHLIKKNHPDSHE